jgi:hypothetical protein
MNQGASGLLKAPSFSLSPKRKKAMIEGMQKYIIKGLMAGLCLLWLVFGILMFDSSIVMGILLMINGLVFGFFAFVCNSKNRLIKILLYIFVVANVILTFTDQMGAADWIVLVIYAALLAFMIKRDI